MIVKPLYYVYLFHRLERFCHFDLVDLFSHNDSMEQRSSGKPMMLAITDRMRFPPNT